MCVLSYLNYFSPILITSQSNSTEYCGSCVGCGKFSTCLYFKVSIYSTQQNILPKSIESICGTIKCINVRITPEPG